MFIHELSITQFLRQQFNKLTQNSKTGIGILEKIQSQNEKEEVEFA